MDQLSHKNLLSRKLFSLRFEATNKVLPVERQESVEHELSETYKQRGEMALLKGDLHSGVKFFDMALHYDPHNAALFFCQGLALFQHGSDEDKDEAFLIACKKFKQALDISPQLFESWQMWGTTLLTLAKHSGENHYYIQAKEKLTKAIALSEHQLPDVLSELHWDFACASFALGMVSGDLSDYQVALQAFQSASNFQDHLPAEFWNEYGIACLEVGTRINDLRLIVKSIHCFKHTISTALSYDAGWAHLARALQVLHSYTHEEDHFNQANECFATAVQVKTCDAELWLDWARFLGDWGHKTKDIKRLRACVEKCQKAHSYARRDPYILAIWAEALAYLGNESERLDLIYDAQNKIAEAIEKEESAPEIWYSFGKILHILGTYFGDSDYYLQAVEKFQHGLSIDRSYPEIWHAMATSYLSYAQSEADADGYEKAIKFYKKALDLKISSTYSFDYAHALYRYGEILREQSLLEQAVHHFEKALHMQKNAIYLHPDWLFHYAATLDLLGDFYDEDSYYLRSVEILTHVQTIDPEFAGIHHRLALAHSHLGEMYGENEHFQRALHHFRLASKQEEENDQVLLDWGVTLINSAQGAIDGEESTRLYEEAASKLTQSAKLGNLQAYYHLSCLYSLLSELERSLYFFQKALNFDALPPLEELMQDDWLEKLRVTAEFERLLKILESKLNLSTED